MNDLISREEVLKLPQRKGYAVNGWETYIRVSDIKELPSAEPQRGRWILDNPRSDDSLIYRYACSECHAHHRARYDFCPSCGADMRPQFEEPEINPCRGCEDYDGKGGCKTKGGCADRRGDSDDR